MIRMKLGVVIAALQTTDLLRVAQVAQETWQKAGWDDDVWITGGIDGNHLPTSYHYGAASKRGQGIDLGYPKWCRDVNGKPIPARTALARTALAGNLGGAWKVLDEHDHLHCQPL